MFPQRNKGETWSNSGKLKHLAFFWTLQTMWCIITLTPVVMAQFCGENKDGKNSQSKKKFNVKNIKPLSLVANLV